MLAAAERLRVIHLCPTSGVLSSGSGFRDILNAIVSLRSVLLVDSDPAVHAALAETLRRGDRQLEDVYDAHAALEQLRSCPCDVMVAGQGNNGLDGLKLLRKARAIRPDLKVIVTGDPDPMRVVGAIRH